MGAATSLKSTAASGESPEEEIRNGFGVPDWLVLPLVGTALSGLSMGAEVFDKREVPPALVPLLGRPFRKFSERQRDAVLDALGRHERFTERVLSVFFAVNQGLVARCSRRTVPKLTAEIDKGVLFPEEVVSALIAADRMNQARKVTAWIVEKQRAYEDDGLVEVATSLARDNEQTTAALKRAQRELTAERRRVKRLEKRLEQAEKRAQLAVRTAAEAERRAEGAEARRVALATRAGALQEQIAQQQRLLEEARRQRRDLVKEFADVQGRVQRLRGALKETRAKLPKEPPRRVKVETKRAEPPPRPAELLARLRSGGARAVLDSKRIHVIVDGYNVCIGNLGGGRLEDKRRLLEQALQGYQSRTGNKALLVYDGARIDWFPPSVSRRTFERVFTADEETADDYIVEELELRRNGLAPVVVTSDAELRRRCIVLGAFVLRARDVADALSLR